ncbi:MAG: hypothetical protein ACTHJW_04995 [Streptosporangiaceae bacterium]
MDQIWIAAAAAIAVVALGVPFVAVVLVSIASRREEARRSLSRQAPGAAARAARRLLGFRTEKRGRRVPDRASSHTSIRALELLSAAPTALAPAQDGTAAHEVRFGHARRSLSDASQYPAGRQPQPRPIRADQRQGAGV